MWSSHLEIHRDAVGFGGVEAEPVGTASILCHPLLPVGGIIRNHHLRRCIVLLRTLLVPRENRPVVVDDFFVPSLEFYIGSVVSIARHTLRIEIVFDEI